MHGKGVLRVNERRSGPAQAREPPRHAQLLAPQAELDRLDARRNEIRPTRDGADPEPGWGGEREQLAEQVQDVRLVARPAATEHVRIDDDERAAHASSAPEALELSAARSQVKARARSSPSATSSVRRRSASAMPAAIASRVGRRRARPPRLRPPRSRLRCSSRPESRRPSPRGSEGRSPRRATGRRGNAHRGRGPRGSRRRRGRPSREPPRRPTRTRPTTRSSTPREPRRLDGASEVLARLERPDREDVVPARGRAVRARRRGRRRSGRRGRARPGPRAGRRARRG